MYRLKCRFAILFPQPKELGSEFENTHKIFHFKCNWLYLEGGYNFFWQTLYMYEICVTPGFASDFSIFFHRSTAQQVEFFGLIWNCATSSKKRVAT